MLGYILQHKVNREATCQFPSGDWNIEYFLWYLHVLNYSRQRKSYVLEIILSPPGRSQTIPIMSFTVIILPLKNPTSYLKNTSAVGLAFWSTRSFCWNACFQGPLDKAVLYFLPGWPPRHAAKISEGPSVQPPHLYHAGNCIPMQSRP